MIERAMERVRKRENREKALERLTERERVIERLKEIE